MNRSIIFTVVYLSVVLGCAAMFGSCTRNNAEAAQEKLVLDGLKKGELPPPPDDKPLIKLAANGAVNELKSRLRTKEQANDTTQWGLTALHYAAAAGHASVARLLIERGADMNKKAIVEYSFVENKENKAIQGAYKPIDLAVLRGRQEIVALLIEQGAGNLDLTSALHNAVSSRNTPMAKMLIEKGANVDALEAGGPFAHTPLHLAVLMGDADMVKLLLSKGADINARTLYGAKPSSLVERLTGRINYGKRGNTPLGIAQMEGHTEIVQILKAHGAKE